jgi:hypothetical protein
MVGDLVGEWRMRVRMTLSDLGETSLSQRHSDTASPKENHPLELHTKALYRVGNGRVMTIDDELMDNEVVWMPSPCAGTVGERRST